MKGFLKSSKGLFQLCPKTTTVGRDRCDLIIQSPTVDLQHVLIDCDEQNQCFIAQDLNTSYGTYVNDTLIRNAAVRLYSGDKLRFGNSSITYELVITTDSVVAYPPVHRQSAWQPLTFLGGDPDAVTDNPVNRTLPHLHSVVNTTQALSNPQVSAAPVPKPPLSVRSRPLSAGSRNRHIVRRDPSPSNTGGWIHGGPGLLRSSSSTDLRAMQQEYETDEQRLAWMKEEVKRLSAIENDCLQKDRIIDQLHRQVDKLQYAQQQQLADENDQSPYLSHHVASHMEQSHFSQRQRVSDMDESQYRQQRLANDVELSQYPHRNAADSQYARHHPRGRVESTQYLQRQFVNPVDQRQHERDYRESTIVDNASAIKINTLEIALDAKQIEIDRLKQKNEELQRINEDIDQLKQNVQDKENQLNRVNEDVQLKESQISELQQRLENAAVNADTQSSLANDLRQQIIQLEQLLETERQKNAALQEEIELSNAKCLNLDCAKRDLESDLSAAKDGLETFRQQIKHACCYVSEDDENDNNLVAVIKHVVHERTTLKAEVQKLKEKLDESKLLSDHIAKTRDRLQETVRLLASNGFMSTELKLELAGLRTMASEHPVIVKELTDVYIQLLEAVLTWQNNVETALQAANIDGTKPQQQHPSLQIAALHSQLMKAEAEIALLTTTMHERLTQADNDHRIDLEAVKLQLDSEHNDRVAQLNAQHEEQLSRAIATEAEKFNSMNQSNQSTIADLEEKLHQQQLSYSLQKQTADELKTRVDELTTNVESHRQSEASLRKQVSDLEQQLCAVDVKHTDNLTELTQSHNRVVAQYKQQIDEFSQTICVLEEQLNEMTTKARDYQTEISTLQSTVSELSANNHQPQRQSPTLLRNKLVVQPVGPAVYNSIELSQLQRDNVELKRQLHEQTDIIVSLRRDLAGTAARLSDISGEVSESQKRELEQNQETIRQQQTELTELRQQLAKLSEIIDKQTEELKNANAEASKYKAAVAKYKKQLNEKETQLKSAEQGQILKARKDFAKKLTPTEDESRIQTELALVGAQCRGDKHDQVITRQRDALIELRSKIRVLEAGRLPAITHDEALQELVILRQQIAELQDATAVTAAGDNASRALLPFMTSSSHHDRPMTMTLPELSEAFELCENQYLSLVRMLSNTLELENLSVMKSLSHVSREERLRLAAERQQVSEQIIGALRTLRERIDRKDELLQGYERDLAKLRQTEHLAEITSGQKENLTVNLLKTTEEVECLRESLVKTKKQLEQEQRLNKAIKQKKTFHLENEQLVHANGWPKHQCVPEDPRMLAAKAKRIQYEKLKRRNYEQKSALEEARRKHAAAESDDHHLYDDESARRARGIHSMRPHRPIQNIADGSCV